MLCVKRFLYVMLLCEAVYVCYADDADDSCDEHDGTAWRVCHACIFAQRPTSLVFEMPSGTFTFCESEMETA